MAGDDLEHLLVSRLTMRHIRQLCVVGRLRSISRAAEVLHISQPALSKAVREVETTLGMKLFDRVPRGLVPTASGSRLLQHCQVIEQELRKAGQDIQSYLRGTTGRASVGAFLVALPSLLPRAIARMMATSDDLVVRVTDGSNKELVPALLSGEIDLIVGRIPDVDRSERLKQEVLYHEPLVLVVGANHELARRRRLSFRDLNGFGWVFPAPESVAFGTIMDMFVREGLPRPGRYVESVSFIMIQSLLRETDMIATAPRQVVAQDVALGLLKILPLKFPDTHFPVGITTLEDREPSFAAKHLISCLRDVAAETTARNPRD
jgi:DNA-binding transcriptional LysR family regulator